MYFWFIWFLALAGSIEAESVICFKGERVTVSVLIFEFLLLAKASEIIWNEQGFFSF